MDDLSFEWQIDEFMVFCRSRQLREKTMNSYEQTLRLFERWCAEELNITTVDKVSESVIRRYILNLQERGKYSFYANDKAKEINYPDRRRDFRKPISPITINNYIRNLRVFFNWLDRDYILKKNPMRKVQQLKVNRQAKEFITDDEFKKLTRSLDKSYYPEHRDYAMIMLMIDSGMRIGECSVLLVEDIDLAHRKIFLRAEITKGRKDRFVFFSSKTETILRRWLQFKDRYVESAYLFPTKPNKTPIQVSNFEINFKRYHVLIGHVLGAGLLLGVLLDGLYHHSRVGEQSLVFSPGVKLCGAKDGCLLHKSLGHHCGVVVDVANSILHGGSHSNYLL
ncbi:MAG: tyrosine-type recombinase/integrase [Ruminiclostridium sp.]|nr:tyrosine-type recombinase/integrase [Ruminiclostridium sp.]